MIVILHKLSQNYTDRVHRFSTVIIIHRVMNNRCSSVHCFIVLYIRGKVLVYVHSDIESNYTCSFQGR